MEIKLNLNIKDAGTESYFLNSSETQVKDILFKVEGLPDTLSAKYSVDDCIIITDKNVKTITSNNTDVIDLKILKNKNIFKQTPPVYKILFKKLGNGSLTILDKNNVKRSFGIFLDRKKETIKFGNVLTTGSKYEKFWEKWSTDVLYVENTCNIDILNCVKTSLKKGSIPCIVLTQQKNNIEKTLQECEIYLQQSKQQIIIILPIETIKKQRETVARLKKLNFVKLGVLLCMESMETSLDCNRTLGYEKGLGLIQQESNKSIEMLKNLGINNEWILCFDQNKSDAANKDHIPLKFNNDTWLNYLFYIAKINKAMGTQAMLYSIPTGLLNKNEIRNHTNTKCDYEDGSVFFFFGGKFTTSSSFYKENAWKDSKLKINGDVIIVESHLDLLLKNNIKYILFGSKLDTGTTSVYSPFSVGKVMDKEFLMNSIKQYKAKIF